MQLSLRTVPCMTRLLRFTKEETESKQIVEPPLASDAVIILVLGIDPRFCGRVEDVSRCQTNV
jgi:hypothetical protein